jgi:hypothetical protein
MSDQRQKNQLVLAFTDESRSELRGYPRKGPNRLRRSAGLKARPLANS